MILLPGQLLPPPPAPAPMVLTCDCGKRSMVPHEALARAGNTVRCPWCDLYWDVRHYTNLVTGKVTLHLARRRPDDIWLPEDVAR